MKTKARRGRQEGNITEMMNGRWFGQMSMGFDGNGKRIRKRVYGDSKAEVIEKMRKKRNEAGLNMLPEADTMTMGELFTRWLQTCKTKLGIQTYELREKMVRVHLKPRLGGLRLTKLTALHIEGLYADLATGGASAWTIRNWADLLGVILNHAVGLKLIPFNPGAPLDKPKKPEPEMRTLDEDEYKRVLATSNESNIAALVNLALASGARQGELLALDWPDVDLKNALLHIRKSLAVTKEGFVIKAPKTKQSRRTIGLPDFAVKAVVEHKAAAMKAGLLTAPIFCTRTGGYLDKKNVLRAFRGVIKKTNKRFADAAEKRAAETGQEEHVKLIDESIRFHDLRHTVASLLLSKGQSLPAVSKRLGHANSAITLRVYAHAMPVDDAKLSDALGRMMA